MGERFKMHGGDGNFGRRPFGGLNCGVHDSGIFRVAEAAQQNFARHAAIRLTAGKFCEGAARTNHGIEQAAGRDAVAKIEAIAKDAADAEMIRERAHDVVEPLADENNLRAGFHRFL